MGTSDRSSLLAASAAFQAEGRFSDARDLLASRLGDYATDGHVLMEYATALAGIIRATGDFSSIDAAIGHARRAVELLPDDLPVRRGLFLMLEAARHSTEARTQIREIRERDPSDPSAHAAEAAVLLSLLRFDECMQVFENAANRFPMNRVLLARFAWCSNYVPGLAAMQVKAIHERYGAAMRALVPQRAMKYPNSPEPERRIRIGLLSSDFRTHSCAFFLLPLLQHLDRSRVHVICVHTSGLQDAVTQQFHDMADEFIVAAELSPPDLAAVIRKAKVDVLLELNGFSAGTSLPAMHLRPAPVQGSYLGYPNTTALDAITFRLVDSLTDPHGAEARATERLLRLDPCFLCYQPPSNAPEVAPCPAEQAGRVTFGSFNNTTKLNDTVIALWSRVLHALPESRLVLKSETLGHGEFAGIVRDIFARHGVQSSRLDLLGKVAGIAPHLREYARIDIGLDTFPYHGTTTTCEAMWMGVPVVSRVGEVHASRVGASVLHAVDLADLAAETDDGFVAAAIALAGNPGRRARIRASLREQMRASALCDGVNFAQRFEGALRQQWREWCSRQESRSQG